MTNTGTRSTRLEQAILVLLVVGQLGLVGCATPQTRLAAPSTSLTTPFSSVSVQPALSQTRPWTSSKSRLDPTCMHFSFGGDDGAAILGLVGLVVVTMPLWIPLYVLLGCLGR